MRLYIVSDKIEVDFGGWSVRYCRRKVWRKSKRDWSFCLLPTILLNKQWHTIEIKFWWMFINIDFEIIKWY